MSGRGQRIITFSGKVSMGGKKIYVFTFICLLILCNDFLVTKKTYHMERLKRGSILKSQLCGKFIFDFCRQGS